MAKKMAVRNQKKTKRKPVSFSWVRKLGPVVKWLLVSGCMVTLLIGLSYLPTSWQNIWPVEIIAFNNPAVQVKQKDIAALWKENNMAGMLAVDVLVLRKKLLENPWVREVSVKKQWPNRLIIEIQEHNVVAKVNQQFMLENGVLVEGIESAITSTPVTIKMEPKSLKQKELMKHIITRISKIKNSIEESQLAVNDFSINANDSWSLYTSNGVEIKIGRKQHVDRVKRFSSIYAAIENKEQLQTVDLRYNNGVAVSYRPELTSEEKNG